MGAAVGTRSLRVNDARDMARVVLAGLPQRWRHTIGVARRAVELAVTLDEEPEILLAAAWLHDIGYADALKDSGFHPLDGARYLDRHRWPARISALVAQHSGACFVAEARGLRDALMVYPLEQGPTSDALTYADQSVGPAGQRMTVPDRMAEMLRRHGPESPNARVHHLRAPYMLATASRVEQRLAAL